MPRLRLSALLLLVLVALAVAAGCGGDGGSTTSEQEGISSENVPANAVAIVAGTPILRTDFERFFGQAEKAADARGEPFPDAGTAEYLVLQNQAVDYLIQRVELDREAKDLGITVTDAEVTQRLDEFKQQYFEGDEEKYKKEIGQIGLTEEDLLADIRAQLISEKIFDEVTKGISVPESEAQAYYDDNEDRFKVPESREVAHILVETKKEAQDIYAQLQDGASFEELAKEHSTDEASAENGGKLTDQKGTFVPEFEEVAFALDTGEIGEPVKSQFGWHVIKALEDTVEASVTPYADVKDAIEEELLQTQRDEAMASWLDDVRLKYQPQVGYATGFAPPPAPPPETSTSSTATDTTPATSTSGG
jgi:parvulin-like peptidyl-prolyl isomerase